MLRDFAAAARAQYWTSMGLDSKIHDHAELWSGLPARKICKSDFKQNLELLWSAGGDLLS